MRSEGAAPRPAAPLCGALSLVLGALLGKGKAGRRRARGPGQPRGGAAWGPRPGRGSRRRGEARFAALAADLNLEPIAPGSELLWGERGVAGGRGVCPQPEFREGRGAGARARAAASWPGRPAAPLSAPSSAGAGNPARPRTDARRRPRPGGTGPAGSGRVAGRGGAGDPPPGRLIPAAQVPAAPRAEFHQRRRGARGAPRRPRGGLRRPGPRVRPAAGAAGAGAGPEQPPRPSRGAAGGARRGDGAGARRDPGVSASCRRAAIRLPAAEPVHVQPRPRR